ncbi:LysE family transporter [Halomonas aquamarina]|uniref:LysE family transporter n=1 Tax=Vreelandella aquamarina TaxID=77097 RepID=A0ACC5VWK2_9GAMM|nr:LysE family transporter [Halomonas aquamarina]MBZ5488089.1 LysE family transporter [Halomonas aquamarina]
MDALTWLTYVGVIFALIIFPGPVALLCTSHGLKFGRKQATATVLGGVAASLVLMMISSLGLGAVLATSETAFAILKLVGGAYLIYLGISAWRDTTSLEVASPSAEQAPPMPANKRFQRGFTVGISNPKDLLFFAALFPNFIDVSQPQLMQFMILALTWLLIDFTLMSTYAGLGASISRWFQSPRRYKRFNRATGGLFMAAGGTLMASNQ